MARSLVASPHVDRDQRAVLDEGGQLIVGDVEVRRRLIERQQFGLGLARLLTTVEADRHAPHQVEVVQHFRSFRIVEVIALHRLTCRVQQ
ncbi:MAG: hypothetical protein C0480_02860 [Bradyrhizobium sp.]|nr:hypothetical protein [Bradyrhizobium sp.]